MMDFKNELNPNQYEAVTTKDGAILILAGAGSGKTRVITYRIAYLIKNCGVAPWNVLAITFTNKAATEMQSRVESLLGEDSRGMWVGTFHKICGKILRMNPELVGYTKDFVVYDDDDTTKLIKDCIKSLELDPKVVLPKMIKGIISKAKDKMLEPAQFLTLIDKANPMERHAASVYSLYQEKLLSNNALDFDDMIINTVKLLENNDEIRQYYNNKFKYVMVDEYQDTNMAQYKLITLLSKHGNLCVVGDDDQSIYAFRGADISNILNFEKTFKDCKVIKLEQNYRSTTNILNCANEVIKNNAGRKSKKLWTALNGGEKVYRFTGENQNDESSFVAREILKLVKSGEYSFKDFVCLFRQNSLSQNIETTLMRNNIPYKVYGGFKFFNRAEIKLLINYLRLLQNPNDDQALKAVINVPPRGIGEKSVMKAESIADNEGCSLFKIVARAKKYTELSRVANQMTEFASLFYSMMIGKESKSVSEFTETVIANSGILEMYQNSSNEEDKSRVENIKEFLNVAKEFEKDAQENAETENNFTAFLEYLTLSTDMDKDDSNDDSQNFVRLMTIHAAKGLEFPVVFVIGMEESLFPSLLAEEENGIEEERRLCYVAITRAKERLYLLNASERMTYGQTRCNLQSRFLAELPKNNYKCVDFRGNEIAEGTQRARLGSSYNKFYGNSAYLNYGQKEDYEAIRDIKRGEAKFGNLSNYGNGGAKHTFARTVNSVSEALAVEKKQNNANVNDSLKPGDRVYHSKFGEGTISKINMAPKNGHRTVEIEFDDGGMKRFALDIVELKKL